MIRSTNPEYGRHIKRSDYVALIRGAGFTPENLVSLRFSALGIYAETFVKFQGGGRAVDGDGYAKEITFVPIIDDEVTA